MDVVDCTIEEFDENWIKIHDYSSNSEGESEPDESKNEFDALYERMKPPPFKIDSPMLKIIEIGSRENSCHNNMAMSYAAALKQNIEAEESITARTTPLDVQQDGVRKLSKCQRRRKKIAMRNAAEKQLIIDEYNNMTRSEGTVDDEGEENRENVSGAHSTTRLFDYPGGSTESHSSTPNFIEVNYETLPAPEMHEENDISKGVYRICATAVKGQDEITSGASVKIKKKKTKKKKRTEKTEKNADTRNDDLSEWSHNLNFSQLQARYPVFKILTHTFDYLQGRIMKNEENMLNKQSLSCANSLIKLCSQFEYNLSRTDCRCIYTPNYVSRIVDNFLIVLGAAYEQILPEPQLKHIFCLCTVITVVAIYYDSFLHQHKEAVQKGRTKEDIDVSVALKNIFYDLDAIAFRHFSLKSFEYKFVESEDELASYAIQKSSLVLLEYTRKIILDMIQRVEASSVDYPCQWSYKDMFVAYGQSPGLLFASFLKNKKLPDLLSWFCTVDSEAQTDNVDESTEFVNEKNDVDDKR